MKLTPTKIAKKVSEILGCKYSHHDLHYTIGGYYSCDKNEYSLLTSYEGMSPYTFSILENGKLNTLTSHLMDVLYSDVFKDMIDELLKEERYKDVKEQKARFVEAEKWIAENNVVEILKDNLSPYYKSVMKSKKELE